MASAKDYTLRKLASEIAKREGKKVQVSIGNVREILSVLVNLNAEFEHENGPFPFSPIDLLRKLSDEKRDKLTTAGIKKRSARLKKSARQSSSRIT